MLRSCLLSPELRGALKLASKAVQFRKSSAMTRKLIESLLQVAKRIAKRRSCSPEPVIA